MFAIESQKMNDQKQTYSGYVQLEFLKIYNVCGHIIVSKGARQMFIVLHVHTNFKSQIFDNINALFKLNHRDC